MLSSFAGLALSSKQRVLTRGVTVVPLPPKAVSVLIVLVDRVGQVVSRETLRDTVWGETFVEEAAITRSISLLRSALAPHLAEGEGIETLSKRGYRFTASVTVTEESEAGAAAWRVMNNQPAQPVPPAKDAFAEAEQQDSLAVRPDVHEMAVTALDVPALGQETAAVHSVWSRPAFWKSGATLIAMILLAVLGYGVYQSSHVQAQQQELAIIDFRDLSSSPDASWMGVALEESLSRELSRDHGITAVAGDQVAVAEEDLGLSHARLFDPAELEQLDKRLGVKYLLTGTYMPLGAQVRMDLVLHAGDRVINEFSETVDQQDVQAAVGRAGAQMRASLKLPKAQTGGELQFFGRDQLAAHFYAEGLRLSRTGDTPRLAREAFSKAVQADPKFAEGHAALAVAWLKVGHEAESRAEAGLALETRGSLPETRRLSLEGSAYRLTGDNAKALEALARLRRLYPDDQTYKLRMASTLFGMNKYAEAAVLLRQMEADKTRPPNLTALELLVTTLAQQGDRSAKFMYADKIMKLAKAEGSRSAEAQAHLFAGMGWMGALNGAKAVEEFNQGEKISAEIGDKRGVLAALTDETAARLEFHLPGAMAVGQRVIDMAADMGNDGAIASGCINLGSAAMYASQLQAAGAYYKRALELGEASQDKGMRLVATSGLVSVYLLAENLPEAEKIAALELQYAHETGTQEDVAVATQHQAELDSYLGRWVQADANYGQAVTLLQRAGNAAAANDVLIENAWMFLERGEDARAAEILRATDLRVLMDNASLAAYAQGRLENDAGDPTHAETVVTKALAKDLVPHRTATGLDVLLAIAVRRKDAAAAFAVSERYAALSRSIPEDGDVRRGAVRAAAEASLLQEGGSAKRAADVTRRLSPVLEEASRLGHSAEVAELHHVLAGTR